MKELSLKIDLEDYAKFLPKEDKRMEWEIVRDTIKAVIQIWASQTQQKGLTEEQRRQYYKILDAFDLFMKSANPDKDTISFEDAEAGFIRKAFKEINIIPDDIFRVIEKSIFAIPDR